MTRSPIMTPEFTNDNIDEIARTIIQSYRDQRKPLKDSFGGTLQSHILISMTITLFVVASLSQIIIHYAKLYFPCMIATRTGLFTQEEMSKMSYRKRKYHRVMFTRHPNATFMQSQFRPRRIPINFI